MYQLWALLDKWKDILPYSNNIAWNQDADNLAMELNFDSLIDFPTETFVSLTNNRKEFFRGIVIKKSSKKNSYSYTAMDYMWYLNKSEEIIQFNNISATKAIKQLLYNEDVANNLINMSTLINKIYIDQTISSIIDDILGQVRAETNTEYIKYMNANIFTIEPKASKKLRAKLLIANDITLESSIDDKKNSVIVISSEEKNTKIVAKEIDNTSIKKIGRLQEVISVNSKNIAQAKQIAKNTLSQKNQAKNSASLNCISLENGEFITPNNYLYFYMPDKFGGKGWYWIKTVSHTLANNTHKINLTLEW